VVDIILHYLQAYILPESPMGKKATDDVVSYANYNAAAKLCTSC